MPQPQVDLGKSDNQVIQAVSGALDAIFKMISDMDISHPGAGKADQANQRDINMALCLDPAKILAEFDRIRDVAGAVGRDAELAATIEEAMHHVSGWYGDAANAFRDHMVRIREFAAETQQHAILTALQHVGELFHMAYQMRQSYCDLAALVTSAALHEIDEHHERIAKVKLAIGKEFVKDVLTLSPDNITSAGVDFLVESVAAFADFGIEGTGIDAVIDGYVLGSEQLWTTFEGNLRRLTRLLSSEHGKQVEDAKKMRVLEPINQVSHGLTDVGSPHFSYANFYTEEYPKDGPFVDRVAEERPKYAEEQREHDPKINQRLEGEA